RKAYEAGEKGWKNYSGEVEKKIQEGAANEAKKDSLIKKQIDQIKSLKFYKHIVIGFFSIIGVIILLYVLSIVGRIAAARI
ncbi:MAG: hypothetical protein WC069_06785, partial [Candidatus Shapirobacteria bacterium]